MSDRPRTIGDVLTAARLACYTFTASDGHPAIKVRGNNAAAAAACAALGLDHDTPVDRVVALQLGQAVVENLHDEYVFGDYVPTYDYIVRHVPAEPATDPHA